MNSCDHDHQTRDEVRLLPLSDEPHHGNVIVCRAHYKIELAFREERAKDTGRDKWDFPAWETLKVYNVEG